MNYQSLTDSQRINRVLIGAAIIVFTMMVNVAPMGWLVLLPLLATYPVFAGIYGYDPVTGFIRHAVEYVSHTVHTPTHRKHV